MIAQFSSPKLRGKRPNCIYTMSDFLRNTVQGQAFVKYNDKIQRLKFKKDGLLPFWIADMDFPVFSKIKDELNKVLERESFAYQMRSDEDMELIGQWFSKRHNYSKEVLPITFQSGVLSSLAFVIDLFSDLGDGVIIQPPVYHAFASTITGLKRKAVDNPLRNTESGYEIDFDHLEELFKIDENKIFILCHPHNPIGQYWSKEDLKKIIDLGREHDVLVVSDEIHADVIFEGEFESVLSFEECSESKVIVLNSFAKTFGTPALSDGYVFTLNDSLSREIYAKSMAFHVYGGNVLSYAGARASANYGEEWLSQLKPSLLENKKYVLENLPSDVTTHDPKCTYQLWMDFSKFGLTPEKLEDRFLDLNLGMAFGTWFGQGGEQFVRLNFATTKDMLGRFFDGVNKI